MQLLVGDEASTAESCSVTLVENRDQTWKTFAGVSAASKKNIFFCNNDICCIKHNFRINQKNFSPIVAKEQKNTYFFAYGATFDSE